MTEYDTLYLYGTVAEDINTINIYNKSTLLWLVDHFSFKVIVLFCYTVICISKQWEGLEPYSSIPLYKSTLWVYSVFVKCDLFTNTPTEQ